MHVKEQCDPYMLKEAHIRIRLFVKRITITLHCLGNLQKLVYKIDESNGVTFKTNSLLKLNNPLSRIMTLKLCKLKDDE